MSNEPDTRTIVDDFGELYQKKTRSGWRNVSRTLNDVTFMLDERKTVDYALALKAGGVLLQLNEMNDRIMISGVLGDLPDEPEYLSDVLTANLTNWLTDVGLVGKERMLDVINTVAWRHRFHPVRDYLQALEWDGKDHIAEFLSHLSFTESSKGCGELFFLRWLVGAIAKIMEQGQNFMLVFDGPQGIGKSYLVRWLCPLPDLFIEGAIHPEDKDSYKRLMAAWIWEVGELEGTTRKADRAALKDFISRQWITVRLPYGRQDITKPAAASLVGTINEDGAGFLNDPTGSRRFAVVSVSAIDFRYTSLDANQIWAQAMHLYKDGAPWELTQQERLLQQATNELYEADSPVEEHLRLLYEWDTISSHRLENFIPSIEVLETLKMAGLRGNDRANLMELSGVLKREGLLKKRFQGNTGFFGLRKRVREHANIYA